MLVMVDELSGKEPSDIPMDVLSDIERLSRSVSTSKVLDVPDVLGSSDLRVIQKNLDKIASQSRWLLIFFKNANKSSVDDCMDRLNNSLQNFQVRGTRQLV